MKFKTLIAIAVAGAFAVPFAALASADGDRMILAQSGASSTGTGMTGGTPSTGGPGQLPSSGEPKAPTQDRSPSAGASGSYHRLDTNRDGFISREEAAAQSGLNFTDLDKDNDGRLSSSEMRGWRDPSTTSGATGGATVAPGKTGTTAGPGEASPKAGAGSDTATSSSSSGTGKAGSGQ